MAERRDAAFRLERSARLWVRAYPRRWRFANGEDLVGTLLDLAGPDARSIRLRDGLSVLGAGWALRWRDHPPLLPWLGYRIFERDLPAEYRVWMIDDLLGRLHTARWFAGYLVLFQAMLTVVDVAHRDAGAMTGLIGGWPVLLVIVGVATIATPRFKARQVWRKHVSGWLPAELRPASERPLAAVELAQFRASTGYEGEPHRRRSAGT